MTQLFLLVRHVDIWTQEGVSRNVNLEFMLGDVNISTAFIASNCYHINLLLFQF
jgi:hypothetical protein